VPGLHGGIGGQACASFSGTAAAPGWQFRQAIAVTSLGIAN